jgi:hypothetical protein
MKISAYWKAVIAAAGPLLTALGAVVGDSKIDGNEWYVIAGAVAVFLGVLLKSNADPAVEA